MKQSIIRKILCYKRIFFYSFIVYSFVIQNQSLILTKNTHSLKPWEKRYILTRNLTNNYLIPQVSARLLQPQCLTEVIIIHVFSLVFILLLLFVGSKYYYVDAWHRPHGSSPKKNQLIHTFLSSVGITHTHLNQEKESNWFCIYEKTLLPYPSLSELQLIDARLVIGGTIPPIT